MKKLHKMSRRKAIGFAACSLAAPAGPAAAKQFPSRPITIVVGFAAGGSLNDMIAPAVAPHLATVLGTPVVVESKVGAGDRCGRRVSAEMNEREGQ
jgi:tripartite-type tricarboxylate transporter receptor subunit TctC